MRPAPIDKPLGSMSATHSPDLMSVTTKVSEQPGTPTLERDDKIHDELDIPDGGIRAWLVILGVRRVL